MSDTAAESPRVQSSADLLFELLEKAQQARLSDHRHLRALAREPQSVDEFFNALHAAQALGKSLETEIQEARQVRQYGLRLKLLEIRQRALDLQRANALSEVELQRVEKRWSGTAAKLYPGNVT